MSITLYDEIGSTVVTNSNKDLTATASVCPFFKGHDFDRQMDFVPCSCDDKKFPICSLLMLLSNSMTNVASIASQ